MKRNEAYNEIKELLDKKNFTPSEFYLMYELECWLNGGRFSLNTTQEILEKGTPYLYEKWLYETGTTIPEIVEDACMNIETFCEKIHISLNDEKSELPPISKGESETLEDVISNEKDREE